MISIIIPLYNKEAYIRDTLSSLLQQQEAIFEVIVVDDGSTDNSVSIIKELSDSRIRLVQQPNKGPSSARNTGVRYAKYDWILYLDADDKLLPNALATFADYIPKQQVDCFCCNFYIAHNEKKRLYSPTYPKGRVRNNFRDFLFFRCMPRTGAAIFHKKFLLQHPFKEHLRRYEDYEQIFSMLKTGVFYRIPIPLFIYNINACSASQPRENFLEDYAAYLSIDNKINWQNIAIYQLYLKVRKNYPQRVLQAYPHFQNKWILHIVSVLIDSIARTERKIKLLCGNIR